jgi:hypothetical protein
MSISNKDWNKYNKSTVKPKPEIHIGGPTEEEKRQRREWQLEQMRRNEAKLRAAAEKAQAAAAAERAEAEAKLEARRAAVRERMQRQHDAAIRQAEEAAAKQAAARAKVEHFAHNKPLFKKMAEEYEVQKKREVSDESPLRRS